MTGSLMEENEEIQHMTIKDLLSMLNLSPYVSTSAEKWLEQMALELLRICQDDIIHMMSQLDSTSHYSIGLKMMDILQENLWLGELVLKEPGRTLPLLDRALLLAQKSLKKNNSLAANLSLKKHGHIRIDGNLECDDLNRDRIPRSKDVGKLIYFRGKVVRTGMVHMLEAQKRFECLKCQSRFPMTYDREQHNLIPKPFMCLGTKGCEGTKFKEVVMQAGELPDSCLDYQEIKIQEDVSKLVLGSIPKSIAVVLEADLVDQCRAGDNVAITGIVFRRWKPFTVNERCNVEIFLLANSMRVFNQQNQASNISEEVTDEFKNFWRTYSADPLQGRDIILKSFCPQIYGMYMVKLAVMLVLAGGVAHVENLMKTRGDSHLLLVGDPGTGKSQFLRFAGKTVSRSVQTTGIGSTSAGLTVAAVRDSGEWQLEAGALVLADRGICCIDEFGSIREQDKTAIHEAMEQQTISVAKAGIICKLNTRCSILAAMNPKGKFDHDKDLEVNVALASPILSRFDLILVILDEQNPEWDGAVTSFLLDREVCDSHEDPEPALGTSGWSITKMKAYLLYIKANIRPEMSESANRILKGYYQWHRSSDLRNAARTTIRLLESLIRLSQAHARLMCRKTVGVRDAVMAVLLVEASMQTCALIPGITNLHASFPEDSLAEYLPREDRILERLGLAELSTRNDVPEPPTSPVTSGHGVTQLLNQHDMDLDQENEDPLRESHTSPLCSWDPSQEPVHRAATSNSVSQHIPQRPLIAEVSGLFMSPPLLQSAPAPLEDDVFGPLTGVMTVAELGLLGGSLGPSLSFTE